MSILPEYFCLHCQRCIWNVSQLKPHFRYCPEAEFQRISFAPPPWERGTIDVTQFHDLSESSDFSDFDDTSSVYSGETDLSEALSSEPHSSKSHPSESHPSDSHPSDSHPSESHPSESRSSGSHPRESHSSESHSSESHSSESHSSESYSECCPVEKSGVRNHKIIKPIISSELEKFLDEALLIPRSRERITLGMGVRALITGKPLRCKNTHGFLITKPPLIDSEPHNEDLRVARIMRPRSKQADHFIRLIDKQLNSPRGISMSKALEKFQVAHNTFGVGAGTVGKPVKQRALWNDLRIRRSRKGELELLA
ncbi:hypothetical protein EPUL_005189 [Erysiphe pulchra]|uniref:Uncharacterized protein n=1 Tax=Erysiphe pulchra TaxID=225359 RepID=A0A2S4PJS3_9PEZI|nr:hypothetical protein EPUL_005189 [Erysiphe pulchra]